VNVLLDKFLSIILVAFPLALIAFEKFYSSDSLLTKRDVSIVMLLGIGEFFTWLLKAFAVLLFVNFLAPLEIFSFSNLPVARYLSIAISFLFIDFTGYYKKQGAKVITEYATKSTEKNKAFEELLKGNSKLIIAEELDPINDQFHADVKASRPGISEEVFAGATWNAEDSLKLNLIDSIGTLQDAIDKVFELSKPSTNKSNNTMSTKKLPRVEAVLGLEAPLAITENASVKLNFLMFKILFMCVPDISCHATNRDKPTHSGFTIKSALRSHLAQFVMNSLFRNPQTLGNHGASKASPS
jgi:hypothetical protein